MNKIAEWMLESINGVLSIDNNKASRAEKHDTVIDKTLIINDNERDEFVIIGITSDEQVVELGMSSQGVIVL